MKILSLTFGNLNSIKGTWHIDFTDDAFVNDGLFAITGQTGAGKTTILDAICLAIYGQTPRISTISNTQNELMSVDKGDCHSEVVILMNEHQRDKIYRFSFEQRRAGKKADGKLQPIKREISLLKTPFEDGDILETKPSACDKKAVELMHMNFEQFTRSVMLAQGNFSAFLKADSKEKGEILEQITGTQLYAKISQQAFEVHKQKKEELNQLEQKINDITIMSDEHFMALKKSIDDDQLIIDDNERRLNTLDAQILFYQDKNQAEQEVEKHQKDLAIAEESMNAFHQTAIKLANANKAHEILPFYHELTQKKDQHHQTGVIIKELEKELPKLHDDIHALKSELDTNNKELFLQKELYQNSLTLFKQVRELDNIINHIQSDLEKITADIHHQQTTIDTQRNTIEHLNNERLSLNKKLDGITKKHQGMINYPNIKQDLGILSGHRHELTNYLSQFNEYQRKLHEKNNELNHKQKEINTKREELKTKKETHKKIQDCHQSLFHKIHQILQHSLFIHEMDVNKISQYSIYFQERIHHLHDLIVRIKQLDKTCQEHENAIKKINESTLYIDEINEQKNALQKTIDELTNALYQENNTLTVLQKNHEAQQELLMLKNHYSKLIDGEPCPLCGSLDHPYANHHPFIHLMNDDTKTAITHITQKIDSLKDGLQHHKEKLAGIYGVLQHQKEQHESLVQQKNNLAHHLSHDYRQIMACDTVSNITWPSLEDSDGMTKNIQHLFVSIHEYLTQLSTDYENYKELETTFIQNSHQLNALNQEIEIITQHGVHLKTQIDMMMHHVNEITFAIYHNNQHINELIEDINSKTIIYQKSPINNFDQALNILNHHLHDLTQLNDAHDEYHTQKQLLESELSHLNIHLANEQKQLENNIINQHHLVQQKQTIEQQYHVQQEKREQFFGDKKVDDEEARIRDIIEKIQLKLNENQQSHQEKYQTYISLNEKITHHQKQQSILAEQISHLSSRFEHLLKNKSFNDIDEFLSSCMDNDERLSLIQKEQSLSYHLRQSKDNLSYWQDKLNNLIKKQGDNPTKLSQYHLDELTLQKEQLKTNQYNILTAIGQKRQQFTTAEESRKKYDSLMISINDKKQDLKVWATLDELIGSKEGIKYRNFVQGLTLELMLYHANDVLSKMDSRYVLIHGDDKNNKSLLQISVIDTAQGSEIRSTKNLSGGESFIVSLALAMGLSQMSSENVSINSLFLDEGFGTLDDEILDVALSVLSSLKETGKMIGIISHIQSLKDRIPTQIQVKKIANGESILLGSGVTKR